MDNENKDGIEHIGDLATTIADIADDSTVQPGKVASAFASAVAFVVHCFSCKNPKKTPTLLKRDSVEVRRCRNACQVSGICAVCNRPVKGFISAAEAAKYPVLPAEAETAKKRKAEGKAEGRKADDDVKPRKKRQNKVGPPAAQPEEAKPEAKPEEPKAAAEVKA